MSNKIARPKEERAFRVSRVPRRQRGRRGLLLLRLVVVLTTLLYSDLWLFGTLVT